MNSNIYSHEQSYTKKNLASIIHRNRLKVILKIIHQFVNGKNITWGDFGCSNGFIIDEVQKNTDIKFLKIIGYDHSNELIDLAIKKSIPNTEFKLFNMNKSNIANNKFDFVTCFETLEHVGNHKNAFKNLFFHLNPKGILFITVPNETGSVGIIKFIGRFLLRKKPYGNFFNNKSKAKYLFYLLFNMPIEKFRQKNSNSYGPHLGFNYKNLESFIIKNYLETNQLKLLVKKYTIFGSNIIYIFKK